MEIYSTSSGKTGRSFIADLMKGIAVILMIQVHVMEQFASPDVFESTLGKLSLLLGGPLCAPVFMIIMGFFIPVAKPLANIRRGVWLFMGGMLLNLLRSLAYFAINDFSLKNPVGLEFLFAVDILHLAGLSLVVTGVFQSFSKSKVWPFMVVFILVLALSLLYEPKPDIKLVSNYITAFFAGTAQWSYFPLVPWYAYVLAGYIFKWIFISFPDFFNRKTLLYVLILCLAVSLLFMPYGIAVSTCLQSYYHHSAGFMLWVVCLVVAYAGVLFLAGHKLKEIRFMMTIAYIGQNVTMVYFIQWILIGNLAPVLYKSQGALVYILLSVVITVLSVSLVFFYRFAGNKIRRV